MRGLCFYFGVYSLVKEESCGRWLDREEGVGGFIELAFFELVASILGVSLGVLYRMIY